MQILSGLSEGQVLQRLGKTVGAIAELTGTTTLQGSIFATITQGKTTLEGWDRQPVGQAAKGKFTALLANIPAGGPYRLTLTTEAGKRLALVKTFFVGDVWILAGQSNMQGCGDRTGAAEPHPLVRAFSMRREWRLAEDNLHVLEESPDACHNGGYQRTPEEADKIRYESVKGVGPGVFFAREMLERSGVPQGLLCTAHGGTSMLQWSPADKAKGGDSLYGSMLLSWKATGQPVSGILWYQGESDANIESSIAYTPRMKQLVAATRRDLGQPELPWVIVQLSRYVGRFPNAQGEFWNSIQEQQRLLPNVIKNFETVPAIDLELDDAIHVGSRACPSLAYRLATAADRLVYGNLKELRPPQLKKIGKVQRGPEGPTLDVEFDHVSGSLQSLGLPQGFSFTDADGVECHNIYKTTLHGNVVRLHLSEFNTAGCALSYGHGTQPICTIHDERGISLPVFRPTSVSKPIAFLPFITTWQVSGIVAAPKPLGDLRPADIKPLIKEKKTYPEFGFINEHEAWQKNSGHQYFLTHIDAAEDMKIEFRLGYDGPFRVWIDGEPFFTDLKGTNPALQDESLKIIDLAKGRHEIIVGMDLNKGAAWGFFFRLARKDVTPAQIKARQYTGPTYAN